MCRAEGKYFGDVEFGGFTGNVTLLKWFRKLCKIYHREGRAFVFWKMNGAGKTIGVDEDQALHKMMNGLKSENNAYVYHCHDHYMCPMGFEITPSNPPDAYKKLEDIDEENLEHWIFVGEPSKVFILNLYNLLCY